MNAPDQGELARQVEQAKQVKENPAIGFAVSRYVLTMGVFVAIVLVGFAATFGLGVNLLPTLTIPIVSVSTSYPGGTPTDLDRQVTRPIEEAVATIPGVASIQSTSEQGFSSVVINFSAGSNQDAMLAEVNQRIADVRGELPSGAQAPVAQKFDPNASSVLTVAVAGSGSLQDARTWANRELKPLLEAVPGVAAVTLSGVPERRIEVQLDPAQLAAYNLSAAQVQAAIQASTLDVPAGEVQEAGRQVSFAARNVPTSLKQLEELRIDTARGVRLADLGVVRDTEAPARQYVRLNGQPIISMDVRKLANANTVGVSKGVRAALEGVKAPTGYTITPINDNGPYIGHSVDDTVKEGLLVAVAVAIICLLALGKLNTAFAVILAIPISLAAAPIVFQLIGASFNIVSLIALIVAMGIVVDDSIVVAENVDRYRRMGFSPVESVLKGASEIFSAVSAATWSLLAVLLPISFLPGLIGQIFREFGLGLAAAIFFSWLEAIFFLTVRMAYTPDPEPVRWSDVGRTLRNGRGSLTWVIGLLRKSLGWALLLGSSIALFMALGPWGLLGVPALPALALLGRYVLSVVFATLGALTATLHHATEALLERARHAYARSLAVVLKRSWVMLVVGALFLASGALTTVPFAFNPTTDDGVASIELILPAGTPLAEANRLAGRVENFLARSPAVKNASVTVSRNGSFHNIELVKRDQRESVFVLTERWQRYVQTLFQDRPEVEVRVGQASGLTLSLSAPNRELLESRHRRVLETIRQDAGVLSVKSSLTDTAPERVFVSDASALDRTGLTQSDLAQTLRLALEGAKAGDYHDGDRTVPIHVRLEPSSVNDGQSLLALPVFASGLNANTTLGELGRFNLAQSPSTLTRVNRRYAANLTITLKAGANALEFENRINETLTKQGVLGGGVAFGSADPNSEAALAGNLTTLGPIAVLLALVLNYLVLGAQFNSFRYPIYLLVPVPLAVVGALWALQLFGAGLDVISVLGMVILVGLVTKNAILLLDFVVERARSMGLREALIEAGSLRLRPIIMTTLTVLVISVPLVLGLGEGAELRRGLGIIILGGLVSSTLLTLYVLPALFYTFERKRLSKPPTTAAPNAGLKAVGSSA